MKAGNTFQPFVRSSRTNSEMREGDAGDVFIVLAGALLVRSELPYTFVDLEIDPQLMLSS